MGITNLSFRQIAVVGGGLFSFFFFVSAIKPAMKKVNRRYQEYEMDDYIEQLDNQNPQNSA